MPWYDYECEMCGQRFEREHPMAFAGKVKCPACQSARTVKVFHAAGVHFKGAGFYVNDGNGSHAAANGDQATETDAPAESKKESTKDKPAAKPSGQQES